MGGAAPMRSLNGWLASSDPKLIGVKTYTIEGTKVKLKCAEAVAPLLLGFAKEFHESIEPIDKSRDDWGYCFRMVRGTSDRISNHSSGTAIDLNASRHPLGASGTFPDEKIGSLRKLAKKYGLIWGGDYRNRKDEMHFEISLNPDECQALIEKLGLAKK